MADLAVVVERLAAIFTECDRDGNGTVNKRELIRACRSNPEIAEFWGLPSMVQQENGRDAMEHYFQEIDDDVDQQITWTEFLSYHLEYASETQVDRPRPPEAILPPASAACEPDTARAHLDTPQTISYVGSGTAVDRGDDLLETMSLTMNAFSIIPSMGLAACVGKEAGAGSVHSRFADGGAIHSSASSALGDSIAGSVVLVGGPRVNGTPTAAQHSAFPIAAQHSASPVAAQRCASPKSRVSGSTVIVGGSTQIPVAAAAQRSASSLGDGSNLTASMPNTPSRAQRAASPMSRRPMSARSVTPGSARCCAAPATPTGIAGSASSPFAGSASSPFAGSASPSIAGSVSFPVAGSAALPVGGSASFSVAGSASLPVGGSASLPVARSVSLPVARSAALPVAGSASLPVAAQRSASQVSSAACGASLMGGPAMPAIGLGVPPPVPKISLPTTIIEEGSVEVRAPTQAPSPFHRQLTGYRGRLYTPSSEVEQKREAQAPRDDERANRSKNNPWRKLAQNLRGFVDDIKDFAEDVAEGWEELFANEGDDEHGHEQKHHHHAHHHHNWPQQHMHPNPAQTMPPAIYAEYLASQSHGRSMAYNLQHYSCPPGFTGPASPLPSAPLSSPEMPFTIAGAPAGPMESQRWQASSLPPTAGASPFAPGNYMPAPEAGAYQSLPLPPTSSTPGAFVSSPHGSMSPGMLQLSTAGMPPASMGSLPPGSMGSLPYPPAPQSPSSWHSAACVSAF